MQPAPHRRPVTNDESPHSNSLFVQSPLTLDVFSMHFRSSRKTRTRTHTENSVNFNQTTRRHIQAPYTSSDSPTVVRVIKSRIMRWAGHVARMGDRRGVYRVLMGKPERKGPPGRPRRRWNDNITMDLQ